MFKSLSKVSNIFALAAVSIGCGYLLSKTVVEHKLITTSFQVLLILTSFLLFVIFALVLSFFSKPTSNYEQSDFGGEETEQTMKLPENQQGTFKQKSWLSSKGKQKIKIKK